MKNVQKTQIFTEGAIGTARATRRSSSDTAYARPCISLHIRVCRLSIGPLVAETSSREATRVERFFAFFHQFRASILTCKPYDANSHFSSSCHALIMRPSDPVARRGDAPIRPLHTLQISPGYSPRFGPHVIANVAMSGPWPQTNRQTDAPSLNSYLDKCGPLAAAMRFYLFIFIYFSKSPTGQPIERRSHSLKQHTTYKHTFTRSTYKH